MKRFIFTLVFHAFSVLFAFGQYSLSGIVTDEKGEPLVGANVIISGSFYGTTAGTDGKFVFQNLKRGKYVLEISFIGFQKQLLNCEVTNNSNLNIALKHSDIMTDEIVVKATRANTKTPVAYTNIDKQAIEKQNLGQDIPYLLNSTPSLVTTSDAGTGIGYSGFRIRGTDMNRINVMINGVPINDAETHGVWWVDMPDFGSSTANIQIQRGVGTSANGAAAFGASVNLQTNTLNVEPYADINTTVGSFNTLKNNIVLGSGLINGKFTFDARLSRVRSDGFIDRSSADLNSYYISGAYYDEKNLFRVNIFSGVEETYQAWNGIPKVRLNNDLAGMMRYGEHGLMSEKQVEHLVNSNSRSYNFYTYENEIDHYEQTHFQALYSRELTANLNLSFNLHYTRGQGYYEQSKEGESFENYGVSNVIIVNDTVSATDIIRRKWLDNDFAGFTFALNYTTKKLDLTVGGGANSYLGNHFGKVIWSEYASVLPKDYRWYDNDGTKTDFNIFAKTNYQLTKELNLWTDLQYRAIDYEIAGTFDDLHTLNTRNTYLFFNPKLGVSAQITDKQLMYFSFAVAQHEPTRTEFENADETYFPKSETLYDYEFGYSYALPNAFASMNLYYMDYKNQLVLTGEINNVGAAILVNMPSSYRTGIEMVTGFTYNNYLRWDFNATLSKSKIKNFTEFVDDWDEWGAQQAESLGETDLSFSPNIIFASNIHLSPFDFLSFDFISKYVGEQYIDNTSSQDRMLDSYFVNDLRINAKFKTKLADEIVINLAINNLFNIAYETNAWVYSYYYGGQRYAMDGYFPQAGTNFLLGVSLKFR